MSKHTIMAPDENGNMVEVEGVRVEHTDKDKAARNLENARKDDFFIRVGHCTEALHKFLNVYRVDYGLEIEEVVAAVYLMNLNNREFEPPETTNWKEYYDSVCHDVWEWFKQHKEA